MCHGFSLTKQDDYFWVNFDHFWNGIINFWIFETIICEKNQLTWGQFHQHFTQIFKIKDPKSAKNTVKSSVFSVLLGSVHIKAAHRILMKVTPVVNFIKYEELRFSFQLRRVIIVEHLRNVLVAHFVAVGAEDGAVLAVGHDRHYAHLVLIFNLGWKLFQDFLHLKNETMFLFSLYRFFRYFYNRVNYVPRKP